MFKADNSIRRDLNRLISGRSRKLSKTNKTREQRETLPATVGLGELSEKASGGGSGIDSPLTEQSRTTSSITLYDASGLIAVSFNVANKITMKDAGGRVVVFDYDT